ncbi:MAG: DUF4126 domain-containing protein [Acidobacteriota bacterium]|nr:DUF4126 domain-containing protein [Acidobacteriota bacterium]
MEHWGPLAFQIAMGVGLAACAGLRAFLPLFVVSIAAKTGYLPLADRFDWLGTWPAIIVFGVAVAVELLSDKIPLVDNALDVVQGVIKPAAGAMIAVAVLSELSPLEATVLGIMAGGSAAGIVQLVKAKVRVVSSTLTAGIGNPILSLGEDLISLLGSIVAIVVPFALLVIAAVFLTFLLLAIRRFRQRAARLQP